MSFWESLFLGLIQGLTEFLPISSSGHLVIFQKLLGFSTPPVFFDILVHLGTLISLLFFFRKRLFILKSKKLIFLLFLGTIPVGVLGFLLQRKIDCLFDSLVLVGFSYLFTALVLFSTQFWKNQTKEIKNLTPFDALFIGIFQALALLPGISRSGMTITAGLHRGLESDSAFEFSFLLAIPAILGTFIFQLVLLSDCSSRVLLPGILGMLTSAVVGYFTLGVLKNILKREKFFWFGVYCAVLGIVILSFSL